MACAAPHERSASDLRAFSVSDCCGGSSMLVARTENGTLRQGDALIELFEASRVGRPKKLPKPLPVSQSSAEKPLPFSRSLSEPWRKLQRPDSISPTDSPTTGIARHQIQLLFSLLNSFRMQVLSARAIEWESRIRLICQLEVELAAGCMHATGKPTWQNNTVQVADGQFPTSTDDCCITGSALSRIPVTKSNDASGL